MRRPTEEPVIFPIYAIFITELYITLISLAAITSAVHTVWVGFPFSDHLGSLAASDFPSIS